MKKLLTLKSISGIVLGTYKKGGVDMKTLETERLYLRQWALSDAADMYEYAQDPRVGPNAGWPAHKNEEESLGIINMFRAEKDVYAVVLKSENKVIGSAGLHLRSPDPNVTDKKQAEIGYVLNPAYWGQGLIPEAVGELLRYGFEEQAFDIIWCGYYDFNHKSKRVVEKSGFTYQFSIKKTLPLLDNQEVEQRYYCLTKEEWETGL